MTQVSRFDIFKDPVGVIQAYRLTKKFIPTLQLILAGGEATDDPEALTVLDEVRTAANDDPDIHIMLLPADAHRSINAIQRASDIVLQKSLKEGFGLTVTEAMWKGKPVIGGDTGGIRIQVVNHQTGFLVNTPEGAALRARYLLFHRDLLQEMGEKGERVLSGRIPPHTPSARIPHYDGLAAARPGRQDRARMRPGGGRLRLMKILTGNRSDRFPRALECSGGRLLMLDYDGTLSPYHIERDKAVPYPGIREILAEALSSADCRTVIVSGRSIHDLLPLLGIEKGIEIWGCHGWERLSPTGDYTGPEL